MWANAGAVWAAATTGISAFLYLIDLGTTISTLRTYYFYEYQCPYAPLASPLLSDPFCRAMRSGYSLHGLAFQFWICVVCLLVAHLTYAFVFWLTLDRRQHPLRLAYFLPFIHLYRIFKLFSDTLSCKRLTELTNSQKECNSLFNAIGTSVETVPQFVLQFVVAMKLGEHVKGSSDLKLQAQKIPTNLMVSLVAAMLAGSYSISMAVWSLIEKRMSLASRAFYCFLIGCQTLAGMLARAMCTAALSQSSKIGFAISFSIYSSSGIIIGWLFIDLLLQSHQYNGQGKNKYLRVAHSFGLAVMTRLVGPTYVIVKFTKSPRLLIWGTLSHIFVELVGVALVFLLPRYIKGQHSPCHSFHLQENEYLTCKVFLVTFFLSLFIIILTTLLLFCLESSNNARVAPCTFTDNACDTYNKPTFSNICMHTSRGSQEKNSHQMSATTFFTLSLFVISILFIQKLQKKCILKRPPLTL